MAKVFNKKGLLKTSMQYLAGVGWYYLKIIEFLWMLIKEGSCKIIIDLIKASFKSVFNGLQNCLQILMF